MLSLTPKPMHQNSLEQRSAGLKKTVAQELSLGSERAFKGGVSGVTEKRGERGERSSRVGFGNSWVFNAAHWMEQRPLADILAKDVLGMNAPRMVVAGIRSPGDLWDTARMELSNTSFTLFGTLILAPLFRWVAHKASGESRADLNNISLKEFDPRQPFKMPTLGVAKKQLAHLAGAFGFLIPFATSFVATPYLRNAITLKQTGTTNFEEIIGLESHKHAQNQEKFKKELKYQLDMVKGLNIAGMSLGLLTALTLGLRAKNMKGISEKAAKILHKTFKTFRLGGSKAANQVRGDLSVFVWWLAPAYLGYIVSARGKHEFREAMIKTVNSVLWFTAFNRFVTKPLYGKKFKGALEGLQKTGHKTINEFVEKLHPTPINAKSNWFKKQIDRNTWLPDAAQIKTLEKSHPEAFKTLSKLKAGEEVASMLISIFMLATTPAVINLFLTKHRYNKQQKETLGLPNAVNPSWVTIRQNPLYYLAPLSHE